MSNIYKGEFQDYEGNVVYPHTTADVVFATDGETVQAKLNELGEGLGGVTGRTDSPEVDDSNILATSKAVHALNNNLKAGNLKFQFATDGEGNYGYLGADGSLIPFKSRVRATVITFEGNNSSSAMNKTYDLEENVGLVSIMCHYDNGSAGGCSVVIDTSRNSTAVSGALSDTVLTNILKYNWNPSTRKLTITLFYVTHGGITKISF